VGEEGNISILDLGCGTGLVGQELRNPVYLVGVDVSLKMIKQNLAKKSNYDELICSEIIKYLENEKRIFDLICMSFVIQFFPPSRVNNLMQNVSAKLKRMQFLFLHLTSHELDQKLIAKAFLRTQLNS
jgi:predicted TPR repeat methyltransferase